MAPVIFCGGVPDVLLRLAKNWGRVDCNEFVVAGNQQIAGVEVTMKQDSELFGAKVARENPSSAFRTPWTSSELTPPNKNAHDTVWA